MMIKEALNKERRWIWLSDHLEIRYS
jgi:hypothetical protein